MFTLTLNTSGAAFQTEGEDREPVFAPEIEVQRILREVAERVEYDTWAGSVFDINGHNVGSFELVEEDPKAEARARVQAYIAQIEKVNSRPGTRFDDVLHSHNDIELRLSDLKALVS